MAGERGQVSVPLKKRGPDQNQVKREHSMVGQAATWPKRNV